MALSQAGAEATRFIDPVVRPIVKATDLGSVQVLKQGNIYLLTDSFGDVHADSRGLGLYDGDTRRLSSSILRVNGERPVLLQASAGGNYHGAIQLTNPRLERNVADKVRPEDALASQKLGIARHRVIAGEALEERVTIVNYAEHDEQVEVTLELAADAADIFEVRGWTRAVRGRQLPIAVRPDRVTFRYEGIDGLRTAVHVAFGEPADAVEPVEREIAGTVNAGWVRFIWHWPMASGEARELRWVAWAVERPLPAKPAGARTDVATDAETDDALFPPEPPVPVDEVAASYHAWSRSVSEIKTDNELVNLAIARSTSDLRLLVNDGPGDAERYLAAGVPWFTTLFGRDAIIASFQALCVRPQVAVETLEVLATLQAADEDPERDAEPGKILHELRTGEMARTGELPFRPYYGSADATPLWLILFAATFDWTGDMGLVDRLWPTALRALDWIDRYGDRDGDGFIEYQRRGPRGLLNQGWKDSSDGIRDRNGKLASTPIALAEVQGYVFDAKVRVARLARLRGDEALAVAAGSGRGAAPPALRGGVLVRRPGLLRDGARRRQAAGGRDRLERRALPVVRDRLAGSRAARDRPADGARHVQRLGDPDVRGGTVRLQPARLPHGHGLAPRRLADRGRIQALRTARGRQSPGWPDVRGRAALRRLPAARAVLRLRPRPFAGPRPVPGRVLAAGLGGRLAVPVPRDDARAAPARGPA